MNAPPPPQTIKLNKIKKLNDFFFPSSTADFFFEFSDSKKIHVHKKLLSDLSPVFAAMFSGDWLEKTHTTITDASYDSFKQFIRMSYEGKITISSNTVYEIVNLSTKYFMATRALWAGCESYLIQCLNIENVIEHLDFAILHSLEDLKDACVQFIIGDFVKFMDATSSFNFGHASLANIMAKLSDRKQSKHLERVHCFCIQWASYHCRQKGVDASNIDNIREQLGNVYFFICRWARDHTEFAKCHIKNGSFEEARE